jgi:hypothetical protein
LHFRAVVPWANIECLSHRLTAACSPAFMLDLVQNTSRHLKPVAAADDITRSQSAARQGEKLRTKEHRPPATTGPGHYSVSSYQDDTVARVLQQQEEMLAESAHVRASMARRTGGSGRVPTYPSMSPRGGPSVTPGSASLRSRYGIQPQPDPIIGGTPQGMTPNGYVSICTCNDVSCATAQPLHPHLGLGFLCA